MVYRITGQNENPRALYSSYTTTSAPAIEPITLDELKTRLRITTCHFDYELQDLLKAARTAIETETYRRLITQTVEMHIQDFPGTYGEIELRLAPIQSITHIKYYDQNDTLTTFDSSNYYTVLIGNPRRIVLEESQQWPLTHISRPNKVIITMVAGYGSTAASVPPAARLAIVEYCRMKREGCEEGSGAASKYKNLVSELAWTGYHKVPS
jgi:uncharacterized phiE125 gp8 family phage protein